MKGNKQLHFGVIFSNLDDTCQYDIWLGIVDFAHKNGIQLTAYVGMYQTTNYDIASHYETCFEIISNNDSLDGVILFSGFIANTVSTEDFEAYISKISDRFPLVSISGVIPGIPSVLIDNMSGTYDAVEHLIKAHGKKNIAFIKGPDGHVEAEARFEGYKKALEKNGIAYDERYVFSGGFTQESGHFAVRKLLRMPGVSADAIVACDDTIATGVLNELKNQNLLVPGDIAVAGFDDDRDSATFIPSISTVRQDFFKIGSMSAGVLLNQINKKHVEPVTYMAPKFISRQSCGCLEVEFFDTEQRYNNDPSNTDSLSTFVTSGFMLLFKQNTPEEQINEWVTAFVGELKKNPFSKESFLKILNEILIGYSQSSKDVLLWNDALSILAQGVKLYNNEIDCPYTVLTVIILATELVQEVRFKEVIVKNIETTDSRIMLRRIASNVVSIFDIDSLLSELYLLLPELSIDSAVVGLYRAPIKSIFSNADRTIEHVLGFDSNNIFNSLSGETDNIPFSDYSRIDKFEFENLSDSLLLPLFFKDEEYGVLLLPFYPAISADIYETLRVNISTAIKGAGLIKEVAHQNSLLQSALEQATEAKKASGDS